MNYKSNHDVVYFILTVDGALLAVIRSYIQKNV
jgi:hypothetical protein